MTTSHLDDAFERWRNALLDALDSPENVMAWQDRRYQFAYQVGQLLVDSGAPGIPQVSDHAVYGVYVAGGGLLYVGQTSDARRRLRDLPVGESHHLATTVPPETWERILVVQWPALLTRIPAQEAQRAAQLGPADCGLGIEYLLQITYRPVMTARRRSTAGGWSTRHIETSRSRGAASSTQVPELFKQYKRSGTCSREPPRPNTAGRPSTPTPGAPCFPARSDTRELQAARSLDLTSRRHVCTYMGYGDHESPQRQRAVRTPLQGWSNRVRALPLTTHSGSYSRTMTVQWMGTEPEGGSDAGTPSPTAT